MFQSSMMMGGGGPNIAELFATTLYTGTGAGRNLVTGIDADLHWIKRRDAAASHALYDKPRGVTKELATDSTSGETTVAAGLTAFLSNGATLGTDADINASGGSYVHWGFKKAARFFDVVAYTGNGSSSRSIAHSLGVAPGLLIIKRRANNAWLTYVPDGINRFGRFDTTVFSNTSNSIAGADATAFQITGTSDVNLSGNDYVAYLFASDADPSGVIRCGVYTGNGMGNPVSLGWRPQFLLTRPTSRSGGWRMYDTARGFSSSAPFLYPNLNFAEDAYNVQTSSVGFVVSSTNTDMNASGEEYFYMAIREP
ncbi:hypothetical protein DEM27_31885 [Metarhizobium album]|uniref:DUF7483 domain-containing protein n=1 Tax=Metarhizobium album TaxID=2182425 RepID=A0A2U2DG27_9HYPH|nr:hypothetical protein [Rhizobium album]PWE52250.1 hypothetical protein DEM27_31885 [Rhizobium album]